MTSLAERGGRAAAPPPPFPVDAVVAVGVLLASVLYVAGLPRVLGGSDEGIYLYEAKRLLDGDVFYRDIFDLITPGAHYLMAALFALFGASMETARLADAVIHGLIVLTIYATCRMLDVRRSLAGVAALIHLAVFQPAWPVASPHWLATLLGLLLVPTLLAPPSARLGLVAGLVAGLLVCVQQQKGIALSAGAAAFLVAERLVLRRPGRMLAFVAGLVIVLVPAALLLCLSAGTEPVVQALVLHPLLSYTKLNPPPPWGSVGPFPWLARYTFPRALAVAPALALVAGARAVVQVVRPVDAERARRTLLLALLALASIGSILYYPDFIHLAFIGAPLAVLGAELVEHALGMSRALIPWAGRLVAGMLLAATAGQLTHVFSGSWRDFPLSYVTPFGRMNFRAREEVERIERIRAVIDGSTSRELFVYPFGAGFYLLTGTSNPTPFQFLLPGYSRPDQLESTVAILEQRQVPHVIVITPMTSTDPVLRYVSEHFEQVDELPLFRRISAPRVGAVRRSSTAYASANAVRVMHEAGG